MILTLTAAAERLGIATTKATVRKLRQLEAHSGRHILVASGVGRARRYIVLERELDAALDGDRRDIESLAERIAEGVQRIEDRVSGLSVRVEKLERRQASASSGK